MKTLRLRRIMPPDGRRVIVTPLDHGVTMGPIDGLQDLGAVLRFLGDTGKVAGVIMHKGTLQRDGHELARYPEVATVLHLSGSVALSPCPDWKVQVSTVEDAIELGCDAVSVHVNLGNEHAAHMLRDLGQVGSQANRWGMPLIAMMYLRGDEAQEASAQSIATLFRVAVELGADIVKVDYPGDPEIFSRAMEAVQVPVLVAGGAFSGDVRTILGNVSDAVGAGAMGVAIGRNIFQRLGCDGFINALDQIMNHQISVEDACKVLEEAGGADG